jgi:outer membrane protein, adhesin transport system
MRPAWFINKWLICFALLGANIANAVPTAKWELAPLLNGAAKTHPDITKAQEDLRVAEQQWVAAKWGRFPRMVAEAQALGQAQGVARIEQPLWTGGKLTAQIASAEAGFHAAQAGVVAAQQNVLVQVSDAYFDAQRLTQRIAVAEANRQTLRRLSEFMSRRVAAEVSSEADLILVQVRQQQASNEINAMHQQLGAILSDLAQWVGEPVASLSSEVDVLPLATPNLQHWVERVLGYSPERQRLQWLIQKAAADINLAKSVGLPKLTGAYQTNWGQSSGAVEKSRFYIGLQFDSGAGLSTQADVAAAEAKYRSVMSDLDGLDRRLGARVNLLLNDIASQEQQIEGVKNLTRTAELIVDSYLRQFQVGRKNWLDVLNAQREKVAAEHAAIDVVSGVKKSRTRLYFLSGDSVIDQYEKFHQQP